MIHMKLPCFHVMNAARDYEEVIIFSLNKEIAFLYCAFHDILVLFKGNVLVAVAAKHVLEVITFFFSL